MTFPKWPTTISSPKPMESDMSRKVKRSTKKVGKPSYRVLQAQAKELCKKVDLLEHRIDDWKVSYAILKMERDFLQKLLIGFTVSRTGSPAVVSAAMSLPSPR